MKRLLARLYNIKKFDSKILTEAGMLVTSAEMFQEINLEMNDDSLNKFKKSSNCFAGFAQFLSLES